MLKLGYIKAKILGKIFKKNKYLFLNNYFRKKGAIIGNNCAICSNLDLCDTFCIEIGNNVVISTNCLFITHDASITLVHNDSPSLFGKIRIGDNCFIGEGSIVLYGVELGDNIIVASGSVVTKSFNEKNIIIGGNPARIISSWEKFGEKNENKGMDIIEAMNADKYDNKFVKR